MFRSFCSKTMIFGDSLFNPKLILQKTAVPFLSLHTQVVDKSLALKTNKPPSEESSEKTNRLAIIFAWMLAKGKHIDRYSNLYLQQGFDVLTVNISPQELIFPTSGSHVIAQKVLDYLEIHPEYEKVIVHAFSVGAYLFGECLVKMKEGGSRYVPIMKKFSGIICDSAIDYYGIPEGLSKAMFNNSYAAGTMQRGLDLYMRLFYRVSTKHYIKCSEIFHNNFLKCPALFFASKADPVASVEAQSKVASRWIENGIDAQVQCWENSPHVSHMHYYPEEYTALVCDFLKKTRVFTE